MSLDLYADDMVERVGNLTPTTDVAPATFEGFFRGAGMATMRGFAQVERSAGMLASAPFVAAGKMTGDSTLPDRYFKAIDETLGGAVDYWTAKPNEVGVAGQVVGSLLSIVPLAIASPPLVALQAADVGTELVQKGVGSGKAAAVAATMTTGMMAGIWMPILGGNLWQRTLVGGAGFNIGQGVATRGAAELILAGHPTAHEFEAFNPEAMTLDALLGLAFGSFAHIIPSQRAAGKEAWDTLGRWAQSMSPTEVAAVATLRTAQHLNTDSTPGIPVGAQDIDTHVQRMRQAIDQLARGDPVDVENVRPPETERNIPEIIPEAGSVEALVHEADAVRAAGDPAFVVDPARRAEQLQNAATMIAQADAARREEGLPRIAEAPLRVPADVTGLPHDLQALHVGEALALRLRETGMGPDEAAAHGAIWSAFFKTTAEKYGVAPADLLERYGVDVQRLSSAQNLPDALMQRAKFDPEVESLARYWSKRTWPNEAEARDMIRRRILEDNERYPQFKAADPAIADRLEFTRAAGGQVKVKVPLEPRRRVDWPSEPTTEEVPRVDWQASDNADDGTPAGIRKEYGSGGSNRIYRAWIPVDHLPIAKGEDITNGRLNDDSSGRDELAMRMRQEMPPAKIAVGPRGKVVIMDGNHRIAWWREQGYSEIPAWVLDERADIPEQPDREYFQRGEAPSRYRPRDIPEGERLTLEHDSVRTMIQNIATMEAGWETIGGRLDVARLIKEHGPDAVDKSGRPTKLGTPAFTEWIPKAEWWTGRPGHPGRGLNETKTKAAVKKALAGEKLSKLEQDTVDYLVDVVNERLVAEHELGDDRWNEVAAAAVDQGLEPTKQNVIDADVLARAVAIDRAAVEVAAAKYVPTKDAEAMMVEARRIIREHEEKQAAGQEAAPAEPGGAAARGGEGADGQTLFQRDDPTTWYYSELARQLDAAQIKSAPAKGWSDYLKSLPQKGVKAEEIRWSGLEDFLALQEGKVTKEQVTEFLKHGGVKVEEVMLGADGQRTIRDAAIQPDVDLLERNGLALDQDPAAEAEGVNRFGVIHDESGEIFAFPGDADAWRASRPRGDTPGEQVESEPIPDHVVDAIDRVLGYLNRGESTVLLGTLGTQLRELGWEFHEIPIIDGNGAIEFRPRATPLEQPEPWMDLIELRERDNNGPATHLAERIVGRLNGDSETAQRPTKFGAYQLPGGKNYRELLLTLPPKEAPPPKIDRNTLLPEGYHVEPINGDGWTLVGPDGSGRTMMNIAGGLERWQATEAAIETLRQQGVMAPQGWGSVEPGRGRTFKSDHYDEDDILAHVRFNERTDADGKRVLFLEELQSDWAKAARKARKVIVEREARTRSISVEEANKLVPKDAGLAKPVPPMPKMEELEQRYGQKIELAPESIERWFIVEKNAVGIPGRGYRKSYDSEAQARDDWEAETGRSIEESGHRLVDDPVKPPAGMTIMMTTPDGTRYWAPTREVAENSLRRKWLDEHGADEGGKPPGAPFVADSEAWTTLVLKRMIRYAAENGFDRVAWTRGEQQVARYTGALRKAVDVIEWTKTDKGVQLVGYKGKAPAPRPTYAEVLLDRGARIDDSLGEEVDWPARFRLTWRDGSSNYFDNRADAMDTVLDDWRKDHDQGERNKVVDTTEKENALSDAIGKAMAEQILKDPGQTGTIEGDNIKIDDTGMAGYYDRMLPAIANTVLKKLGGGKVAKTSIDLPIGAAEGERPLVRPLDEEPQFDDMDPMNQQSFAGAEGFHDGEPPLYSETRISIGGRDYDVQVVVDRGSVQVLAADGTFHLYSDVPTTRRTQDDVLNWLVSAWKKPGFWQAMQSIGDELPGTRSGKPSEHPAFDLTPELKKRALDGLPLFQGAGQPAQAPRGSITFGQDRTLIALFETANASTLVHETGHMFLQMTRDLATREGVPPQAAQDWATLASWLKIEGGEIPREAHEQFARGWEKYLQEGVAPNEGLRSVFQRFRDWLLEVYNRLAGRGLDAELSDEVRGVMARMLDSQARDPSQPSPEAPGAPQAETAPRAQPPQIARQGAQPAPAAATASAPPGEIPASAVPSSSSEGGGAAPGGSAAESPDMVANEAHRIALERPDLRIRIGTDEEGGAIYQTAADFLEAAKADAAQARDDKRLITAAAECLLGNV